MTRDDVVMGFVGLGIMGGRMAANLQKAGYKLIVHDLQRQAASHHLNAGAAWADNPRALAGRSDVIFSSLPEPPDVEAVALGPDGLIAGMKPGTAYFDLSTNSPSVVKKLHAAFAEKGLQSSPVAAYGLTPESGKAHRDGIGVPLLQLGWHRGARFWHPKSIMA
jgi:3-hydroxyisobutyrate dehydrogenase-like beta-hydroxyacid dehydrogenase